MSRYQGGKKRLGKKIHSVMIDVENELTNGKKLTYFEPFVGMASVLKYFGQDNDRTVLACDANNDIVQMWKAIQNGWIPPKSCTNKHRQELRDGPPCPEKTVIGFGTSFNGSWFLGESILKSGKRDPALEAYNGIMKVKPCINKIDFLTPGASYTEFSPEHCLVYCDPPYANNNYVQDYFRGFNHEVFWEKMDQWSEKNIVMVSESSAPKHWKKIWGKDCKVNVRWKDGKGGRIAGKKSFEDNLYIHSRYYSQISKQMLKKVKVN